MKLQVQSNPNTVTDSSFSGIPGVLICPHNIGDDEYWIFKVDLGHGQSIIAFPKFLTIGIGFSKESDWNTNLPYTVEHDRIWGHIKHNKGDERISDDDCKIAIQMLCTACEVYKSL